MRILLIHQYFLEKNDGGGSRFNEMTRIWAANGHDITVLAGMVHYASGTKNPKYKGKYTHIDHFDKNVTVIRSHVSPAYNVSFIGRLWAYFSFVMSSIYAGLFKVKGKYDVILVTSPPLFVGITAYMLSRLKRIPFVFEVRDLWPESAIETGVLKSRFLIRLSYWLETFLYKKAKLINVLTPAFRDALINEKNIPANKIIFIPNAADVEMAEDSMQSLSRDDFRKNLQLNGKKVITYVGAHGVANHLSQVLETAALIKEDQPDVLFLLIGEGMQKPMLKEKARALNLDNVRFLDAVPKRDVFNYIIASDFGAAVLKKTDVFKTIYANKTFDYMSCKKPVFLLIDGISRTLIEEAKCGIYVEPETPTDFAAKIRLMASKPDHELKQMGENGYEYVKNHFERKKLANEYVQHLERIISKDRSDRR